MATPFATYLDLQIRNSTRPIVLVIGKKYRATCRVKIDGALPIGTNGQKIGLAGSFTGASTGVLESTEGDGGKVYAMNANGPIAAHKFKQMTVADILANPWAELFCEWTEPSGGTPGYRFLLHFFISFPNGSSSFPALLKQAADQGFITDADGKLWIDKIEINEVDECDLEFDSPSYSKTEETAPDADDGTITINATSSFTKQYSLDGVAWQSSNLFTDLAPGFYTIYVKDSNPATCQISQAGIQILESEFEEPDPPDPEPDPAPLSVDAKPTNANNLVPWYVADGYLNFNSWSVTNCCWDIPAAYRLRSQGKNNLKHALVAVNGEEFTFYINFDTPINDPSFATWKLALVDENGVVNDDVAPLVRDLFDDGVTYNIYAAVTLNGITINKYYKLLIYNGSTFQAHYLSGLIEVLSLDSAKCLSTRLQYRATINLYGFRYESLPDYFNVHRARIYRIDEQAETTLTQYRAVSSGQLRNVHYELDRWIALEAYYFNDIAHRAMDVWQMHDVNIINDVSYLLKTPYKKLFDQALDLYKGRVELFEIAFSTRNRYNRLGDITVIEGSDFLLHEDGGRLRY